MSLFFNIDGSDQGAVAVRLGALGLTSAGDSTISIGNIVEDDPTGVRTIVGLQPCYVEEPSCTAAPRLFTGYTADRRYRRGPFRTGPGREIDVSLLDQNAVFNFRLITGSDGKRPAETHIQRIDWLLGSAYLSGLIVDDGLVYRGNPRPFGEADYRGQYPLDVLNDISAPIFQSFSALWDQTTKRVGLFFNQPNATTHTSTLTISNVPADVDNVTVFAPLIDAEMVRDPQDVYSTVRMTHKYGTVLATRASTATAFLERGLQVNNDRIGQASALVMSQSLLDRSADEADTITFTVQLPASKVGLIDATHRLGVRFAHLPGFETLTYTRVAERNIAQTDNRDIYNVTLKCSTHGLSPGGGGAGGFPFQGACSVVPAQIADNEELSSSTIQIGAASAHPWAAPTAGRELIAYVWGRGTITGTPGCTDNGSSPTWTEHTNSPLTPAGGSQVILRAYHKIAIGDETLITIASGGSGNKSAGCVFEIPAAAIAERTTNAAAGAGPPETFTGSVTATRKLLIVGTVFNADDISHDYAGTVAAPVVEVFDGTIQDNFSPGYWLGYVQSAASISGTWNHNNGWASLNYGIDCPAVEAPISGQQVPPTNAVTPAPDGVTTIFFAPYPYATGSLHVEMNGSKLAPGVDFTETDYTTGKFTFTRAPLANAEIVVWFQSL
jgi:hypothetical protein